MSKLSQLYAELSEQAAELGFESLGEAEQAGYGVDWKKERLVDGRELAHDEWLRRREEVIKNLEAMRDELVERDENKYALILGDAILFVKEGEI